MRTVEEILTWIDEEIVFASEEVKLHYELDAINEYQCGGAMRTLKVMWELKQYIKHQSLEIMVECC